VSIRISFGLKKDSFSVHPSLKYPLKTLNKKSIKASILPPTTTWD
jgi:hypothetical protein